MATKQFESAAAGFSNPKKEEIENEGPELVEAEVLPDDAVEKEEEEEEEEKDPMDMTYAERLEKLEISDETAMQIIDDMCDQGSYIQKAIVRKSRDGKKEVHAAFITRDTRTQGYITEYVAKNHGDVPVVYNKLMGELQLAGSLIFYNDKKFEYLGDIEDDEDFKKELFVRVKTLSRLPAPVTVKLTRELSKFDLTVAAAMAPGYEDFF